ncbi:unnamed protein product [Tilletia controversa]|nr:unnamed protein product [Tilletia controversa]CAD6925957.1 unnamed protein product [Tilletia controversa]
MTDPEEREDTLCVIVVSRLRALDDGELHADEFLGAKGVKAHTSGTRKTMASWLMRVIGGDGRSRTGIDAGL